MGHGTLDGAIALNPFAKDPEFDLKFRLLNLKLKTLNEFTKHYSAIDFEKGEFDLVTELRCKNRKLGGYFKPMFRDFAVLKWPKDFKEKTFVEEVKEVAAAAVMKVFKNHPKDQFATSIPIEGTIDDKETRIWTVIVNVLRNGFVQAFVPQYNSKDSK